MALFDASIPVAPQLTDFSCSVGATFFCLQALGLQLSQQDLQDIMVPALVSPDVGLLDGSGTAIAKLLRDHFGLAATNKSLVTFDEVAQRAGNQPVMIGGRSWFVSANNAVIGHWVGVRRFAGDQLILANPGGTGPNFGQQFLDRPGFDQRGGFAMVWVDVAGGGGAQVAAGQRYRVANTQGEGANLRREPAATSDRVTSLAEGAVVTMSGDDHAWRQVTSATGDQGWVANEFLSPVDGKFQVSNTSGTGVNLRATPSTAGALVKNLPEGSQMSGDEHAWRQVNSAAGDQGWIADDLLIRVTA